VPHLAGEVPDDGLDVVADDVAQLGGVDRAVGDARGQPAGKLVVPQQRVTVDLLPVAAGELDELVGRSPVVLAADGFEGLPLHDVLGGHRRELAGDPVAVGGVVAEDRHVDRGADPQVVPLRQVAQRPVDRLGTVDRGELVVRDGGGRADQGEGARGQ